MTFFMAKSRRALLVPLVISIGLQGCTTVGGAGFASQTATDRAIGQCVASMFISAGIGALAGAAIGGRRSVGQGALIGTAVGVGACAVLMQVAQAEDKERIRQAELDAIESNQNSTKVFTAKSGKSVAVTTNVVSAPVPSTRRSGSSKPVPNKSDAPPQFTTCRYSEQTISVDGQSANGGKQMWCRLDTGDWKPIKS